MFENPPGPTIMNMSSVLTAIALLVATPAHATITLTYSGAANIDIDGVTQVNANVAWSISFDESGVSDIDVDNNDGDFNDVPITDMRVLVNGTTYIIDIGTTDANLDIASTSQYDWLRLTWVGGSPLMDGRAAFYTAVGALESNGFFGDVDEFDSAQNGAFGGNDNTSSHDSFITFSASRPLNTTTGEQLVMDHDFPNGTETMQLGIAVSSPPVVPHRIVSWGQVSGCLTANSPTGSDFVAISLGSAHGLALDTSGQIHEWCLPPIGQVAPSGTGFTAIAASESSNLALDAAGVIHAWGTDNSGILTNVPSGSAFVAVELGSQGETDISNPNPIPYGQTGVALHANGQIHAWGADHFGQVSNAPAGSDFSAISCKFMQCLALDSSGRIHAWGGDHQGAVSVPPTGTGFVAIATGLSENMAIDATGQIHGWRAGGDVENYPTGNGYTAIAYGVLHGLALDSTGTIHAWGNDLHGQVSNAPTQSGFSALDAGTWWSAALLPTIEPVPAIGPVGRLALTALMLGLGLAGMRVRSVRTRNRS